MYKDHTYEVIKSRMMDNMNLKVDKREGSFINNMSSGIAMEQAKSHMRMDDILSLGFIETTFNEYLDLRVGESGIYRKQGKKAIGAVKIVGKEGTVIENGTIFLCNDLKFVMLNDVVLGQDDICHLEALEVGKRYNVLANSIFTLQEKIDDIENITNTEDFTGGIDIETDDELRERYNSFMDDPPTSGNAAHYRLWATEVDGVDRAIVTPRWDKSNGKNGNGTVKVMIIGKDNTPVSEDIINECIRHIEEERPISETIVTVVTPSLLNVTINASIEVSERYDIEGIKEDFNEKVEEYLKDITNELVYAKLYGFMANTLGVEDIIEFKINNSNSNITIAEDKIVNISDIQLSEVI